VRVQVAAARVLLRHGADVNAQCPPRFDRRRALDFAVMVGSGAVAELLLDAGAAVSLPPGYSQAPLHEAVLHDRPDLCRLLVDRRADPNELNADGCSALQASHSEWRFHAAAGGGAEAPQIVLPPNLAVLLTHCGQSIFRKKAVNLMPDFKVKSSISAGAPRPKPRVQRYPRPTSCI